MIADGSTELQQFHDFLGKRLAMGDAAVSVETAVDDFRQYQQELADLQSKLQVAEAQSARGESAPFDAATTKAALQARLHAADR